MEEQTPHHIEYIGSGFIVLRTSEKAQQLFWETFGPDGNIFASEIALSFQYANRKERSYLRTVLFCRHVTSVNAVGKLSCAVHVSDGTFVYLTIPFQVILAALQKAEAQRATFDLQQMVLNGKVQSSKKIKQPTAPAAQSAKPKSSWWWSRWWNSSSSSKEKLSEEQLEDQALCAAFGSSAISEEGAQDFENQEMYLGISLTEDNYLAVVSDKTKHVLINVFTSWSEPCKHFCPTFTILAQMAVQQIPDILIACVDASANPSVAATFGISAFPTVLLFPRNRKEIWYGVKADTREGACTIEDLSQFVVDVISETSEVEEQQSAAEETQKQTVQTEVENAGSDGVVSPKESDCAVENGCEKIEESPANEQQDITKTPEEAVEEDEKKSSSSLNAKSKAEKQKKGNKKK